MKELKEKKALSWHLNYYKKKFINGQLLKKAALLPLDKAIIKGEGFTWIPAAVQAYAPDMQYIFKMSRYVTLKLVLQNKSQFIQF